MKKQQQRKDWKYNKTQDTKQIQWQQTNKTRTMRKYDRHMKHEHKRKHEHITTKTIKNKH